MQKKEVLAAIFIINSPNLGRAENNIGNKLEVCSELLI